MCGRAAVVNPDGITEKVYGYTKKLVPSDWKPRYNLNPREEIPTVYYDPFLRQRVLRTMHWNLIPSKLESRDRDSCVSANLSAGVAQPALSGCDRRDNRMGRREEAQDSASHSPS